jgi:SRSO17 transposase
MGKVGNCQVGVFMAYVSERGHALLDKRLYLPREWTEDPQRCRQAGVPQEVGFKTKPELALEMLRAARNAGHLLGRWVTADEAYGQVPDFRDALEGEGLCYMLEVPCTTQVFSQPARTGLPQWSGRGRKPCRVRLVEGEARPQPVRALAAELVEADWQELTVAEGAQGPRRYQFAARRVWESRDGVPGRESWLVLRRNLDASELKYYLSNAPLSTPLLTLGRVGAMRWPIETEFETEKGETGLDEYEVRSWEGWQHHVTLALLAGAFLLSVEHDWGEKDAPLDPAPGQSGAQRVAAEAKVDARGLNALAGSYAAAQ